ncbi:RteC domain-containing protein [Chitinophaga pollutisoli]|uniref:RteC domain-containing protein n=1 Tax=Chitinophaga pollutisoli TaxID=3133966 RepID=A0ABZ2YR19_9BACT
MTTINPEEILVKLLGELQEIADDGSHSFDTLQQSARACSMTLDNLRGYLTTHAFPAPDLEIFFFKHIKPSVEGRLLFFLKLFDLLGQLPLYNEDEGKAFWQQKIQEVERYIFQFGEIWHYFNAHADHLDLHYFTRPTATPISGVSSLRQLTDPGFETPQSHNFACITASRMLIDYCSRQLGRSDPALPFTFTWTGSAQALTEVIYGFNEMQVLDGKRHEIAKVKAFFERVFNFPMSNIYKNWEHIRLRKKAELRFSTKPSWHSANARIMMTSMHSAKLLR